MKIRHFIRRGPCYMFTFQFLVYLLKEFAGLTMLFKIYSVTSCYIISLYLLQSDSVYHFFVVHHSVYKVMTEFLVNMINWSAKTFSPCGSRPLHGHH